MSTGTATHRLAPVIPVERALAAVDGIHARAGERSLRVAVAVVDAGGDIVALARMDATVPVALRLAVAKARTAAAFGADTRNLTAMGATAPALAAAFGSALAGDMALIPGGAPVRFDDVLCGGVGVGGAGPDEDHELAVAAVALLGGDPAPA
jgi:glc operon protein GlcG